MKNLNTLTRTAGLAAVPGGIIAGCTVTAGWNMVSSNGAAVLILAGIALVFLKARTEKQSK